MRQLYCVYARNLDGKVCIVGPFKTKPQARKAGARDWDEDPAVEWRVVPLTPYSDAKDNQISLVYERLYDPTYRPRKKAEK